MLLRSCLLMIAAMLLPLRLVEAQLRTPPVEESQSRQIRTEVSFEIFLASNSASLHAQDWGTLFDRAGATVQIRQPIGFEKPEISETTRGRTRYVQVRGILERDGGLILPGRVFRLTDSAKVREWVVELQTYGAQGSTVGQPGFGLSPDQFQRVFQILEGPVPAELDGRDFSSALQAVGLPDQLPLRLNPGATELLRSGKTSPGVAPSGLMGLSRGTVLAIVLESAGLGFQPSRTPAGKLELVALPLDDNTSTWPVGWPLDKAPLHAAPKLLVFEPLSINQEPLSTLLPRVSERAEIPILIDARRLREGGIKLDELRVSFGPKRSTWRTALDQVLFPKMLAELVQDEAGKPFIRVTTNSVKQLNERSRQREMQLKLKEKK